MTSNKIRQPIQPNPNPTPDDRAQRVVEILKNNNLTDRQKRDSVYKLIKEQPEG